MCTTLTNVYYPDVSGLVVKKQNKAEKDSKKLLKVKIRIITIISPLPSFWWGLMELCNSY